MYQIQSSVCCCTCIVEKMLCSGLCVTMDTDPYCKFSSSEYYCVFNVMSAVRKITAIGVSEKQPTIHTSDSDF